MTLETPVALLIFNRPGHTARVFEQVRKVRPSRLLVVGDGPRHPGDVPGCEGARAVLDGVDWDCDVRTRYAEENLGCRTRVSTGLAWVFDQVEEAIVLEDDCVPHPSFFRFCAELLERYRDDTRVMTISGTNFFGEWRPAARSYHFSLFPATWGWASWARCWRLHDPAMAAWPRLREEGLVDSLFADRGHRDFWVGIYDRTHQGLIDTWDYPWLLTCWAQHTLQIVPSVNLVTNIGFGSQATHTFAASNFAELPAREMAFPMRHPAHVFTDHELDRRTQEGVYNRTLSPVDRTVARVRHAARRVGGMASRYRAPGLSG